MDTWHHCEVLEELYTIMKRESKTMAAPHAVEVNQCYTWGDRLQFNVSVLIFKVLPGFGPNYLRDFHFFHVRNLLS